MTQFGGMPVWALLKPLGMLALMVSIGIAAVNHLAGPWSQRTLKNQVAQVRSDFMSQVLQPWKFSSPESGLTVHIRDRADNGDLLGLMMHAIQASCCIRSLTMPPITPARPASSPN